MATLPSHGLENETTPLPVVRIDALDETYVLPLREYFVTHGCQVFVNNGSTENVTYHFIVGDWNFVKRILVYRHTVGKKNCIICWDEYPDEELFSNLPHTKIVCLDPEPLTAGIIHSLFSFFFTSQKKILDQRTKIKKQDSGGMKNISPAGDRGNDKEEEKESVTLDKSRIRDVMASVFEDKKVKQTKPPAKQHASLRLAILTILLTGLVIFSPFLLYLFSLAGQIRSLQKGVVCLTAGDVVCTTRAIRTMQAWRAQTNITKPIVLPVVNLLGGSGAQQAHERLFFFLDTAVTVVTNTKELASSAASLFSGFIESSEEEKGDTPLLAMEAMKKSLPVIRTYIDLSFTTLSMLTLEPSFPFSQPAVRNLIAKTQTTLDGVRKIAETGEQMLRIYPTIAGFKHPEKILVLLQNNSELRPTGGFIGSLARMDLEEGMMKNLKVEDVYTADGQLKGHVPPPQMVTELLGQEHWYLRDSNWHPDFRESAAMAQWFYEKETGERVDVVIGINTSLLTKLLAVTGPVDLPTYNDRITAENFYAKSFYYTQVDFFPGSTQKKDFLGVLTQALMEKVKIQGKSKGIALFNILSDALASSDIQLFVDEPEIQNAISSFGWGGVVPQASSCVLTGERLPCAFSYLFVNEANVSINKVNMFIERSQERVVTIGEDGGVKQQITRRIKNISRGEPGAGTYTAYIRFLLPPKATIDNATIDGKPIPTRDLKMKKQALPFGMIENDIAGVTALGVAVEIPPGQERLISVSYAPRERLVFGSNGAVFSLFEQKQPGVDVVPTNTTITYPSWWQIEAKGDQITDVVANPGSFGYNTNLSASSEERIFFQNHP